MVDRSNEQHMSGLLERFTQSLGEAVDACQWGKVQPPDNAAELMRRANEALDQIQKLADEMSDGDRLVSTVLYDLESCKKARELAIKCCSPKDDELRTLAHNWDEAASLAASAALKGWCRDMARHTHKRRRELVEEYNTLLGDHYREQNYQECENCLKTFEKVVETQDRDPAEWAQYVGTWKKKLTDAPQEQRRPEAPDKERTALLQSLRPVVDNDNASDESRLVSGYQNILHRSVDLLRTATASPYADDDTIKGLIDQLRVQVDLAQQMQHDLAVHGEHKKKGELAYQEGRFEDALEAFEAATNSDMVKGTQTLEVNLACRCRYYKRVLPPVIEHWRQASMERRSAEFGKARDECKAALEEMREHALLEQWYSLWDALADLQTTEKQISDASVRDAALHFRRLRTGVERVWPECQDEKRETERRWLEQKLLPDLRELVS